MSDQFEPVPVSEERILVWKQAARASIPDIGLGHFNWPMMVLSLAAEVERLRLLVPTEVERSAVRAV